MVGWSSGKTYLFHGYIVGSIPTPTTLPEVAESPNTYFPQGVLMTQRSQLLLACSSVVEQSAVNRLVVGSIPTLPAGDIASTLRGRLLEKCRR